MTQKEFNRHVSRLTETFVHRWPATRIVTLWEKVKDLDEKWFSKIVDEMILKFDDRVNVAELAAVHRNSLRSKETLQSLEQKGNYTTGAEYFTKLGFKDFSDFLKNKNKAPSGRKGK